MLTRIHTHDVEPTDLDVCLTPRLTLLAGDNGLGKTFLLDLAWWALTGSWAHLPPLPLRPAGRAPTISAERSSGSQRHASFESSTQFWQMGLKVQAAPTSLAVYARPDGSFRIFDDFRTFGWHPDPRAGVIHSGALTADQVWNGLAAANGMPLCNGLIRDWVAWQFQKPALFDLFSRVLAQLSPHPGEIIKPGPPRRVSIEDARDIPTLLLPYGEVPVTHASAGMRRVIALAYMLVWTWHEHTEAARLQNRPPLDEMVFLLDEVDAHLHPTWQRVLLPALFEVFSEIERSLRVQVLASTHAPLVLASVESLFDPERDKLLHFALREGRICVDEIPWAKQGDAVNWLVSEAFGLREVAPLIAAAVDKQRGAAAT